MQEEIVADEIGDFIVKHVIMFGKTGVVLGLSGGVDSTCVAALAQRSFIKYNSKNTTKKLEVVGYMLPSQTNARSDVADAIRVANALSLRYEIFTISPILNAFESTNPDTLKNKFHNGNLTSEIRAVVLHAKSAIENKMVIGTGNRDEDYGVGYYTLFGDGAVHLSPIGNLPKRLVRQMTAYLGFADLSSKPSTPGLEQGQSSIKDLGYDFEFVELVLEGIDQGFSLSELAVHPQVIESCRLQTERYQREFYATKFINVSSYLDDVARRHAIAISKGKLVCPPIAQITLD